MQLGSEGMPQTPFGNDGAPRPLTPFGEIILGDNASHPRMLLVSGPVLVNIVIQGKRLV